MVRRERWLRKRESLGMKRPLPLVTMTVNCMSISTRHKHAAQILRNAAAWHTEDGKPVDVIMASECDDFDGHHVLGIDWIVLHDVDNGDKDGCLLAVRATRGRLLNPHYRFGARALFGAMADRWIAVSKIEVDHGTPHRWVPKADACHAPPKRGWLRWPAYMTRVGKTKFDLAGGDWNKLGRAVLPALGRQVRMVHILGLATRRWIPTGPAVSVEVGGDHKAVAVVLWPNHKEN
jgi:hypothetical protein